MAGSNSQKNFVVLVVGAVLLLLVGSQFIKTVPPGRVGVATLFGNVVAEGYTQGIHIPVNPTPGRKHTSRPPMFRVRISCKPSLMSACNIVSMERWRLRFWNKPVMRCRLFVYT